MWEQVERAVAALEKKNGKKFGDPANPLLVSCRSGAKFSMPGMMDTVLNIGLNDDVAAGLAKLTGDERFVYDAYRRLVQMYATVVLDVSEDLPFAMKRFCASEGLGHVTNLSLMRGREFAEAYGVRIIDGPLAGLCARAVVVLDKDDKVVHTELVKEIAHEPDYDAALAALAKDSM